MAEWISVKDRLPEDCSHVLICFIGLQRVRGALQSRQRQVAHGTGDQGSQGRRYCRCNSLDASARSPAGRNP